MDQILRSFSGARIRRVIDYSLAKVPEHAHDWPVLSIFVIGAYENGTELGPAFIGGPSAVLYRAGAAHKNRVAATGFEQIEIEFDPAWLGCTLPAVPVSRRIGGLAGAASRILAQTCLTEPDEDVIRLSVRQFVEGCGQPARGGRPEWAPLVDRRLRDDPCLTVGEIASQLGRHPAWLGTAYRLHAGESLGQTAARFRVERAACLLRETDEPPAVIAACAGFCDQSHMIRTFRRVLGRLPSAVRADRPYMRRALRGA